MRNFAFVSRHEPSLAQLDLARAAGIELTHIGDRDAFAFPASELKAQGYVGVVVVHPQAALTAFQAGLEVGVFNNVNRASVGEKPQFETTNMVVSDPQGMLEMAWNLGAQNMPI